MTAGAAMIGDRLGLGGGASRRVGGHQGEGRGPAGGRGAGDRTGRRVEGEPGGQGTAVTDQVRESVPPVAAGCGVVGDTDLAAGEGRRGDGRADGVTGLDGELAGPVPWAFTA